MKKSELKKVLKPIIQECVKEVIFEDGVLSGIITEVARGLRGSDPIVAAPSPVAPIKEHVKRAAPNVDHSKRLKEHKKKLLEAIGGDAFNGVNLFEGTSPIIAQQGPEQQAGSLSDHEPHDPGVDISSLFGSVGTHWNAHMSTVNHEK